MTAAHCLEGESPENLAVFAGSTNTDRLATNLYPVNETIMHPQYDGNNYDFAILKLKKSIPFGRAANAACLPQDPSTSYANENLIVSGWGNIAASGEDGIYPKKLQVTFN